MGKFAYIFGNDNDGAAAKLHEAINGLKTDLQNRTVTITAIDTFKSNIADFQQLASAFNSQVTTAFTTSPADTNVRQAITQFKDAANEFGYKLEGQNSQNTDVSAASRFVAIGDEFKTFANQKLGDLSYLLDLAKVRVFRDQASNGDNSFLKKAQDFKTAADQGTKQNPGFLGKTNAFGKAQTTDPQLHEKFQAMATAFKTAAEIFGKSDQNNTVAKKFQEFANELKTSAGFTNISAKAEAFKTAADNFATYAGNGPGGSNGFLAKANKVTNFNGVTNITDIQSKFLVAAEKFVEAANAFEDIL